MRKLRAWLEERGLGRIAEILIQHDIDLDILPDLSDEDLEEAGLSLGERKRLRKAIGALRAEGDRPAAVPREQPPSGQRSRPEAERRQVTILFCDLVGSSTLAEQLDPEDMGEVLRSYRQLCAQVVERHGGTLVRYIGDGVLVCFGYPVAHEDDAIRAINAGLEIIAGMPKLPVPRHPAGDAPLNARIGIHTGMVVVGDIGHGDRTDSMDLVGGTPNIAARLQELAAPNSVTISGTTRKLAAGHFVFEDLGTHALKGISEPVAVYQVRRESGLISRFEAAMAAGLTPLVDREEEIALLHDRWRQAQAGEGQITLISGEPGIGKSRIVQALHERIRGEPHIRQRLQCSPHHTHSALYPVIRHLEHASNFALDDPPEVKLGKLTTMLGHSGSELDEDIQLIASLLSIPDAEPSRLHNLSPERRKQRTIAALLRHMEALARQRTLMLVFEDVHWIDPTSLELLDVALDRAPQLPILIVVTFRPEFSTPWRERLNLTNLTLTRLAPHDRTAIVERITGEKALPAEVVRLIVARTDGVPLFLEEMTKAVLESALGEQPSEPGRASVPLQLPGIPATLHESLMARLDHLRGVKEVTQVAATIGRDFSKELLAATCSYAEEQLEAALEQLVASGLILRRSIPPHAVYSFKHALIRDAAYESLLRSRRRELHARIAAVLQNEFPDVATNQPEIVAQHYTWAHLAPQALEFWQRAATIAVQRSANAEAIAHIEAALELNEQIENSDQRMANETSLRELLCVPLEARSWGSRDIEKNLRRLHSLVKRTSDRRKLFSVLHGLCGVYILSGRLSVALKVARKMSNVSQQSDDIVFKLLSERSLGMCYFFSGDFGRAISHFDNVISLYDRIVPEDFKVYYVADPCIVAYCMSAWACLLLGDDLNAKQRIEMATTLSQTQDHAFSRIYAFGIMASFYQTKGDPQAALRFATLTTQLSRENNNPYWEAWAQIVKGWSLALNGQHSEGIAVLTGGIEKYWRTGSRLILPYAKALLVDAYRCAGEISEGMRIAHELDDARANNQVRFFEASTERIIARLRSAAAQTS